MGTLLGLWKFLSVGAGGVFRFWTLQLRLSFRSSTHQMPATLSVLVKSATRANAVMPAETALRSNAPFGTNTSPR